MVAVAGLVALAVVVLLVIAATQASAHAMLEGSTPAADAVLTTPPTSVDLTFNEAITLLPDSVRVFGPDGGRVDDGAIAAATTTGRPPRWGSAPTSLGRQLPGVLPRRLRGLPPI